MHVFVNLTMCHVVFYVDIVSLLPIDCHSTFALCLTNEVDLAFRVAHTST